VRVTIGETEANDLFLRAAEKFRADSGTDRAGA
jgi:hypothetical protein